MIDVEMNIKTITETKKRYIPYNIYSNCVDEIPQDIKLEINGGYITLKEGSKIYKTLDNSEYITTEDKTTDFSNKADGKYILMVRTDDKIQNWFIYNKLGSGNSLPENNNDYDQYFIPSEHKIYTWDSSTSAWKEWRTNSACYPLGVVEVENGVLSFAKNSKGQDMIFNGAGYIGHHAFILPHIKTLNPDGLDEQGNLKSINGDRKIIGTVELSNGKIIIALQSINNTSASRRNYYEVESWEDMLAINESAFYYIKQQNNGVSWAGGSGNFYYGYCPIIEATTTNSIIEDFIIRQPYEDPAEQTLYYEEEYEEEREVADFKAVDTIVFKAKNILEIQEGSLTYQPELGIDLKRFLDPDVKIQNETFEAYTIQRLGEQGVNPIELLVNKEQKFKQIFDYIVVEASTEGMIAK